jgi:hypothetical protein
MIALSSAVRRTRIAVVVVSMTAGACASSAPRPAFAPLNAACESNRSAAVHEVGDVIAANLACREDADCVSIGTGVGGCFDTCSSAMNRAGVPALREAQAHAGATSCAAFIHDKCPFIVPPCITLPPPKCTAGTCR